MQEESARLARSAWPLEKMLPPDRRSDSFSTFMRELLGETPGGATATVALPDC
jgi:hypothetical protein